jgi:hypothetical protein
MPSELQPTAKDIRDLVDITFQIAIAAAEHMHGKTTEEVATWTAAQLRGCGYETVPMGASWGYLTRLPSSRQNPVSDGRITLVSANRPD